MDKKILVLGVTGMLGGAVFRYLSRYSEYKVYGTTRRSNEFDGIDEEFTGQLIYGIDAENQDSLEQLFLKIRPNTVINCIGVIKQLDSSEDPLIVLPINSVLPHRLAKLSEIIDARFLHVSTDCVFSGDKGNYNETDFADARDLYGRSKFLGEVNHHHCITLRTSIIGHEISKNISLVDWFLSQTEPVHGYKNAIFSGLPAVEIARIIMQYILPFPNLSGVYHLAASPISKYDLLCLIANEYKKNIKIIPNDIVKIDRSLNASKFQSETGYRPPEWVDLIKKMHDFM